MWHGFDTKTVEGDHDHHARMTSPKMAQTMGKDMRRRFLISLLLTVPGCHNKDEFIKKLDELK